MPSPSTEDTVRQIVRAAARLPDDAALTASMPLLDPERGLDSLAILEIIVGVEERLGVRLSADDVGPETFGTLDRLVALVASRRAL